MLNDRTEEISHLEAKLGELQKDMALLHASQDEVNKNITQMEHKLKDLNSDQYQIALKVLYKLIDWENIAYEDNNDTYSFTPLHMTIGKAGTGKAS